MSVVILDIPRLLDESAPGKAGGKTLQTKYAALKKEREQLPEAERATFDAKAFNTLEKERAALRAAVLSKAKPHVEAAMKARGAKVVVPADRTLAFDPSVDITDEVLKKLG